MTLVAGRFRIVRELGRGGMGAVYKATNTVTGRAVALKRPHAEHAGDPRYRARFIREARAAAALRHPNVIDVLDVVEDADGTPVMVMELLSGQSLAALLAARGAITLAEVARHVVPVLDALLLAHERGVVHRDLKPENVFLSVGPTGQSVPKLLDFGIAKLVPAVHGPGADAATQTGALVGTPHYMAPEQVSGARDVDHRADVWAAGAVVYECLGGRRPFDGENFGQIFAAILEAEPIALAELAPGAPDEVVGAVQAALTRSLAERSSSVERLIAALAPHLPADVVRTRTLVIATDRPSGQEAALMGEAATIDSEADGERGEHDAPAARTPAATTSAGVTSRAEPASGRGRPLLWAALAVGVVAGGWALLVGDWVADDAAAPPPAVPSAEPSPSSSVRAGNVEALIDNAEAARWEAGEAMAREALEKDPNSYRAKLALVYHLFDKARLAARGRLAAAREAEELLAELFARHPDDEQVRNRYMILAYLTDRRIDALEGARWFRDHGSPLNRAFALSAVARIAWIMGWLDVAEDAALRCLELGTKDARCLRVRTSVDELVRGNAALDDIVRESELEKNLDEVARVRARVLLGRLEEAQLTVEVAQARGLLDEADAPYVRGIIAAARGQRERALDDLAKLEAVAGGDDMLPMVRINATWQTAELAALAKSPERVVAAAKVGIERGFCNAAYWAKHPLYTKQRDALDPVIETCRRRSEALRAEARARGLVP